MRSTPAFTPAFTTSANTSTASSKSSVPIGFNNLPVGPTSSATYACLPLSLIPSLALTTAAFTISSRLSAYLNLFAPNVLARIMSAPASAYSL